MPNLHGSKFNFLEVSAGSAHCPMLFMRLYVKPRTRRPFNGGCPSGRASAPIESILDNSWTVSNQLKHFHPMIVLRRISSLGSHLLQVASGIRMSTYVCDCVCINKWIDAEDKHIYLPCLMFGRLGWKWFIIHHNSINSTSNSASTSTSRNGNECLGDHTMVGGGGLGNRGPGSYIHKYTVHLYFNKSRNKYIYIYIYTYIYIFLFVF